MTKKIRVLHVLSDANIGGAGRQLLSLLAGYDRNAFHMEAVLPRDGKMVRLIEEQNIPVTLAANISDKSFSPRGIWEFYKIFKKIRPDILHTHAALTARIAARLYGKCKIIYTRHTAAPGKTRPFFKRALNSALCDAVIMVSPILREQVIQTGIPDKKINVVCNGAPPLKKFTEEEKLNARAAYGVKKDSFVICLAARLVTDKGQDVLLDAAKGITDEGIEILLAGGGPDRERLEERIRSENIKNARYVGFAEDMETLHNITDVQVNASMDEKEAYSLSLLEGMSLGIPSVVSETGGNLCVVEHEVNGLFFKDKDSGSLRDALLRLRNDSELYKKLKEGTLKLYNERFTASRMVRETEAVYKNVIKKQR